MSVFELLAEKLRKTIEEFGISEPTGPPIGAIPKVLEGKNVLLMAPMGTGKTEAAILPVLSTYLEKGQGGIGILYIAPLRALNRDMMNRLEKIGEKLGIKIAVRHGDTPAKERQRQARSPPDMLITTPETLQAILTGKVIRQHLRSVRWVIVDEVHELTEDKRGVQLALGLERLRELSGDFQIVGLSATVGSPAETAAFLAGTNREIEVLDVHAEKSMKIEVESPMPVSKDVELAEKLMVEPTMMARIRRMKELVETNDSVLTFVNTREAAEMLGSKLRLWQPDLPIAVHHGSLSRDARIEAEIKFRDGKLRNLICTSSMELGIDIGRVSLVVQYSSPRQVVRLVQRVGRSGHRVGRVSVGNVISTSPDDVAESIVIARRAVAGQLEKGKIHELALDVLAHQLVGISLDKGWVTPNEALALVKRAYPFRNLNEETLEKVLDQLKSQGLLARIDGKFKTRKPGFLYYFTNLSVIPDTKKYRIRDLASRKSIGSLDEEFVAAYAQPETTFVCKGETWKVVEVDHESSTILVEQSDDPLGAVPIWEGEMIPVPFEVAQEVGDVRGKIENDLLSKKETSAIIVDLEKRYPVKKEAASWLIDEISELVNSNVPVPSKRTLLLESSGDYAVLHACFGSLVNQTLAWILAELLSARLGASVQVRSDPYRIAFRFPERAKPELIIKTLNEMQPKHLESVLDLTLKHSSMFQWRLMQVAKRFGAIRKDADLSKVSIRRLTEYFKGAPMFQETFREVLIEKLDPGRTVEILNEIQSGLISVQTVDLVEPTVLAWPLLNQLASGELVVPRRAEREILLAVKSRLERHPVKLHCLNCNDWTTLTRVTRLPEKVSCKKCGAGLLTILPRESEELLRLLKKYSKKEKLQANERKKVERAYQTADLILTHGRRAIVAMAGRGIGPKTAVRILSKDYREENDFYREILRAERIYARTRRFWA